MPRSASNGLAKAVVTGAFSIQLRNGGLYRPSSTSGTSHHSDTAITAPSHTANHRAASGSGFLVANHTVGGTEHRAVATAFTPPTAAKASADPVMRHAP